MKEATGELNMTVVTIVAIAALMGFFYLIIWPNMKASMALTSACNSAGTSGTYTSGTANTEGYISCSSTNNVMKCSYWDGKKNVEKTCN